MNAKKITSIAIALTILNTILLTVQLAPVAKAAVAGMDYMDLRRDRDFRKAVEYIVEDCSVSGRSISC